MRAKIRAKKPMFPDQLDLTGLDRIRTFQEFDDRYTAPIHGFRDAEDYWTRNSSRQFLPHIKLPTLLVNAANDPFLGPGCYPREEAAASRLFSFRIPGHRRPRRISAASELAASIGRKPARRNSSVAF